MGKCDNCRLRKESAKAFDIHWMGADDCPYNKCPVPDFPKTNADRLRAMTDEELAEFMAQTGTEYSCPPPHYFGETGFCRNEDVDMSCRMCWLDWLKRGVDYGQAP